MLRSLFGAEIWYWDKSKFDALGEVREVSPESIWREAGDGWRIVACAEGHEAQYWENGQLVASTWKRLPFTEEQWSAFALSVVNPAAPAPAAPPEPAALQKSNRLWRHRIVNEPLSWRDAERAGVSVAICGAAITALFCGQALRAEFQAKETRERAQATAEALRDDGDVARAIEQRQLIRDFAAATRGPQILSAAAEVHEVLAEFGMRASSWRASDDGLSAIVNSPITDAPVRDIVAGLEAKPHLCNAVPEIAGMGRFEVRANIGAPGANCSAPRADRQP